MPVKSLLAENICLAKTSSEWAALGCDVGDAAGTTVSSLDPASLAPSVLGLVEAPATLFQPAAGWYGGCDVSCSADGEAFAVTGVQRE